MNSKNVRNLQPWSISRAFLMIPWHALSAGSFLSWNSCWNVIKSRCLSKRRTLKSEAITSGDSASASRQINTVRRVWGRCQTSTPPATLVQLIRHFQANTQHLALVASCLPESAISPCEQRVISTCENANSLGSCDKQRSHILPRKHIGAWTSWRKEGGSLQAREVIDMVNPFLPC